MFAQRILLSPVDRTFRTLSPMAMCVVIVEYQHDGSIIERFLFQNISTDCWQLGGWCLIRKLNTKHRQMGGGGWRWRGLSTPDNQHWTTGFRIGGCLHCRAKTN